MALAYTAPTWTDGSGEGISASNLQAISNCIEGLVQGSDKAVHHVEINGSVITLTYADGTSENFTAVDIKGISSIAKTGTSGLVDTYTITYSDGTTSTFTVTNGAAGQAPTISATASADATSSANPSVTVTKTGTDAAPNFDFAFSGLKGAKGDTGATGANGQDGQDGTDGVSPEVIITSITGGHTVEITDADHPSGQSFNVMDGTDGQDGQDGQDGADGVSPGVTITSITGGNRVTITDKDHPSGQSFDVMNGTGSGDMLSSVYDSNSAVANAGGIEDYVLNYVPYAWQTNSYQDAGGVRTFSISNADIVTTGHFDFYANVYGVVPTDVVVASGSIEVKFKTSDNVTTIAVYMHEIH